MVARDLMSLMNEVPRPSRMEGSSGWRWTVPVPLLAKSAARTTGTRDERRNSIESELMSFITSRQYACKSRPDLLASMARAADPTIRGVFLGSMLYDIEDKPQNEEITDERTARDPGRTKDEP